VEKKGATETQIGTKVVFDAEGVSSRLLRQTGLEALNRKGLVNAVEADAENLENVTTDEVEVYLGKNYAPGFYAWLIPRLDGTAKVGLAAKTGNPKELLHRLMSKHPVASKQLGKAKVSRMSFHPITLGGPIPIAYSDGFLAVGDVASQVKSTTGGGVIFGLTCARIAAEVAAEAIQRNDVSSGVLQLYQRRYVEAIGFDLKVMVNARKFLDSISDDKIDDALRFGARFGLDKALQDVEEIDFQGQTLLRKVWKPAVLAGLAYFVLLYLTANPLSFR
jgi:digeranylgeranylglycerophospholipid reductase